MINVLMVGVGKKRLGGMWTVANEYINNREFNKKVKLYYVPTSTNGNIVLKILYMLFGYMKILYILLTKNIKIVHIHMAEKGSTFRKGIVARIGKLFHKNVIIHIHAGPFMDFYNSLSVEKQYKVKKILNKYSDKILVLGEYWKIQLSKIVSGDKIIVLYNGVKVPCANPYNINAKNIVFFGVMNSNKGIYDLINAIELIDEKLDPSIKVKLCGKDDDGIVLKMIKQKKLYNRIKFVGWIDKEKKETELKNAMLNVLPSYYEALSMTIIEAMAYGIPVITTNISTMKELLVDDDCLIDVGNVEQLSKRILKLSNEEKIRKKKSTFEYNRAKEFFNEDIFIRNTLKIYEEL